MTSEFAVILAQFGPAGLMGLLWILERRHAATRDRQLTEAHRRLASQEQSIGTLMGVLRDNTRAIVTLEQTQRHLVRLGERLETRLSPPHVGRPQAAGRSDAA